MRLRYGPRHRYLQEATSISTSGALRQWQAASPVGHRTSNPGHGGRLFYVLYVLYVFWSRAMNPTIRVSAAEFQRGFGVLGDKALKKPVAITKHGRDHLVLMSAEEYDRLTRSDRWAFTVDELTAEEIAEFKKSRMDRRHNHLNGLLEDRKS